jgi:hypothetical protein
MRRQAPAPGDGLLLHMVNLKSRPLKEIDDMAVFG